MTKTLIMLGTATAIATVACTGLALAQFHRSGGAPAAPHVSAPAAPHISAPAAPHISAPATPHFNAAPRMSAAPHIAAPTSMPRAGVRAFAPQAHVSAPRNFARQTLRGPAASGRAVTRHALQERVGGRSATRSVSRNAAAGRSLTRNASRNSGNLARAAAHDRAGARAQAKSNLTNANRGPGANRVTQAAGRGALHGSRGAAFGAPLGERNRNFADRRRFFDERRRFHHGGFVGWFGPVFWPYAYDDVFDYAFWPNEYDNYGFWATAYDDLLGSVLWSPDTRNIYASVGAPEKRRGRTSRAQPAEPASRAVADACRADEPGLTRWPVEQIAQVVQPTPDQQKLLDNLTVAAAEAGKLLQAACPENQPATPLGRLDAITRRLDAMLQAVDTVRAPLADFYAALSDEQKARFNAMGQEQNGSAARGEDSTAKSQARVCGGQAPGGLTEQATRRISQEVRPRGAQRDALDGLRDASAKAADLLRDACSTQTPITPVARLDAMGKRLQAMLDAVKTVRPALARFYDSLSDEQKAHFNIMRSQQG
jgi:hypothetical protein